MSYFSNNAAQRDSDSNAVALLVMSYSQSNAAPTFSKS